MNVGSIFNRIYDYSLHKLKPLKFSSIINANFKHPKTLLYSSKFLYNELPIRLAQRITDLNKLPYGLSHSHSINKIREWYITSFSELMNFKCPETNDDCNKFGKTIQTIFDRHSPTLTVMSKGIIELKHENKISDIHTPQIQALLNRFYKNRIEIRILLQQYLCMYNNLDSSNSIIDYNINLENIINDSINNIQYLCQFNNIDIDIKNIIKIKSKSLLENKQINMVGLSNYIYYIFFELIKNSIQAVNEKHKILKTYDPLINIDIIEIDEHWILVKIFDNGIGIKEEDLDKIWYYSYSTNPIDPKIIIENNDYDNSSPISGFGYGLPISELNLEFFNDSKNNIRIHSSYKNNTTVYVYLKKY